MFPASLPKGRFPSSFPSLKPSLGFPSMAGTTTSVWATYDSGVPWLGTGTRQGQQHQLCRQGCIPTQAHSGVSRSGYPLFWSSTCPGLGDL